MDIQDVLRDIRLYASHCPEPYVRWADAIEQEVIKKETWLSPDCYEELMRERQETLHEMARLRVNIDRLRQALDRIKANRYGLQSLMEDGADEKAIAEYWANTVMEYQQIARAALGKVAT